MMLNMICAALAATTVYRLELTDETPYIVGQDGVKREVVLVEPAQYLLLTGQVAKVWQSLNSTEQGRRSLHGRVVETQIDEAAKEKVVHYADGYRHAEKFAAVPADRRTMFGSQKPAHAAATPRTASRRRLDFIKRRDAAKEPVSVEHDATTGKDIVK